MIQLADKFDWKKIDEICSSKFCKDNARTELSRRLVIGLLLIKQPSYNLFIELIPGSLTVLLRLLSYLLYINRHYSPGIEFIDTLLVTHLEI